MTNFKLILCPVDFSGTSDHALTTAIDLAKNLETKIKLVHVYQYPIFSMPETELATPIDLSLQKDYEDRLHKRLEGLCKKYSDQEILIDSELVEGVPYIEIVQSATNNNADLIVMGTHGRTGLYHMLLGSVAERVVRTSTIPVMSVPKK